MSVLFTLLFSLAPVLGYFEYLQLVLQWPTTFCHTKPCPTWPPPNNFTIHGLWPDSKGKMLNDCGSGDDYDDIPDAHMRKQLESDWPNLTSRAGEIKKYQEFWGYEFNKHGTCSMDRYNQDQYFELALKLKNQFDLLNILRNHGIIPGKTCTVKDVEDAIKAVTAHVPNLNCIVRSSQRSSHIMELLEIGICFDREATQMIDCRRRWKSHPDINQPITLPR
uniref:S25-RNase n=3 Tax=Solanum subgen. Lycopersicon TaxID=49274 RepID=Q8LP86_SOLPE|nr:S25-RNase [Solanum peruvianum]